MYHITLTSLDYTARQVRQLVFDDIPFGQFVSGQGPIVDYHCGPLDRLLPSKHFDVIVTPGNSYGHMTGGFDGALVDVFSGYPLDAEMRTLVAKRWMGEIPVGSADHLVLEDRAGRSVTIVYAPTMRVPKTLPLNSEVPYLATLAALREVWLLNDPRERLASSAAGKPPLRVLLPVMGMGTGRLPIQKVARQMQLALLRFITREPIRELGGDGFRYDHLISLS
jgi:O-acetyl-ADP-ribose deacetylase (regulator of RNase III)